MRIGISTWVYAAHPIEQALFRVSGYGFRVLELWGDQSQLDPRLFPESGVERIRELAGSLGVTFHSLHAPFSGLDIASPDEGKREESIRCVARALDYAAGLGCRYVVVHPGSGESMTAMDQAFHGKERLLDAVRRLRVEAERRGVEVLLENMTERSGRRYGSRMRDLVEVVEVLGGGSLGLCFDPGHTVLSRLDVFEELTESKGFLRSLHANDNDGVGDLHLVPLKAKATVDWLRFLTVLEGIGYDGPFMLEIYGGESADGVVEDAKALCVKLPGLRL